MGKSVDSAQATRFEAVPKQMAGLEIAPPRALYLSLVRSVLWRCLGTRCGPLSLALATYFC